MGDSREETSQSSNASGGRISTTAYSIGVDKRKTVSKTLQTLTNSDDVELHSTIMSLLSLFLMFDKTNHFEMLMISGLSIFFRNTSI